MLKPEKLGSTLDYLLQLTDEALKIAKQLPEIAATKEVQILERFLEEQTIFDEKTKKNQKQNKRLK